METKICGKCINWRCDEPLHLIGHCIIYRGIVPHGRMCYTCTKYQKGGVQYEGTEPKAIS